MSVAHAIIGLFVESLICGGIVLDSQTSLCVFDTNTVIAQRYRDEELHLRLLREVAGPDLTFMHGNTKPYKTQFNNDFLDEEDIRRIDLPAISPGVNPNEHVWNARGV